MGQRQSSSSTYHQFFSNNKKSFRRKSEAFPDIRRADSIVAKNDTTQAAASGASKPKFERRRWSSAALITNRNGAAFISNKPKRLTPRQCHLVIKAWSRRHPKDRLVKDAFIAIFTEAEELKEAFGIERLLTGKKLRVSERFVKHTTIFTETLDFVVRNLDDMVLVTEHAEQLGRKHAMMPMSSGFRAEHWNIFTECLSEKVTDGEEKEAVLAWRLLVQTILYYMKQGYDREMLRIHRRTIRRAITPVPADDTSSYKTVKNEESSYKEETK